MSIVKTSDMLQKDLQNRDPNGLSNHIKVTISCSLLLIPLRIILLLFLLGEQWLSGRVLDSRPRGRGFEPHRRHCVVVLEQDTFILA